MDELLDQLIILLQAALTGRGTFTFFKGKQAIIAQSNMPLVMAYGEHETTERSGTVRDRATYDVAVEVVLNAKSYYDMSSGQGSAIDAETALRQIMAERESDGDLKTNTVGYIVNNNLTINGRVLYVTGFEVDYGQLSDAEFPAINAILRFTAEDRPNRV